MKLSKILFFIILIITVALAQDNKFGALVYYELNYVPDDNKEISNQFEYRRIYFSFAKKMSEKLSYKFQTDVGRKNEDGRLEVFIKNAKIDWKTDYGLIVIGLQGMNVFEIQKNTWGYRSIDKTAMNKNNWASSADLGIGYYNNSHNFNYSILITNGTGFKLPENDSYKKISTQIYYGNGKLNSQNGVNSGIVFTYEPYHVDGGSTETKFVTGLFGGYASGPVRIGAEFDQLIDSNISETTKILSGYGNFRINEKASIFARLDNVDYGSTVLNYIIGGIAVSPEKGLKIMPNIRYSKSTNKTVDLEYKLNFEFDIK